MSDVVVTRQDGFTIIQYRKEKRPLKIATYYIDGPERKEYLLHITAFIERESNAPAHLAKMDNVKFFALVERLSTLVCREFSPTANWNVTKPEIRGAVLFILYAGINAGGWPATYKATDQTFVQYAEVAGYE